MTTPNQGPKRASPAERYDAMSARFLNEAEKYLAAGDLQQASEKVWGAAAEAIKAYCQRRGWNHHGHNYLRDAVYYTAYALSRNELFPLFDSVNFMHANFYEHQAEEDELEMRLGDLRMFVSILTELSDAELPDYAPNLTPAQQRGQEKRLRILTRKTANSLGSEYSLEEAENLPAVNPPNRE